MIQCDGVLSKSVVPWGVSRDFVVRYKLLKLQLDDLAYVIGGSK